MPINDVAHNLPYTRAMSNQQQPALTISREQPLTIKASGAWQVQALARTGAMAALRAQLRAVQHDAQGLWDLSHITALDHVGAQLLWNAWGRKRPPHMVIAPRHQAFFDRIEQAASLTLPTQQKHGLGIAFIADKLAAMSEHLYGFIALIGQLMLDLGKFALQPTHGPWKEISANIYRTGYQALGITALVGFLIGVVLSYLSAQQLHTFGGDIYLVDILGMSIVRELGPLLAAILVAGRSGSSITAQLGVMRVTEELDAMLVMGLPHGFRLVMPKVLALAISMPLLVIWTDAMALMGGIAAAQFELNLSPIYFMQELPNAVPIANYWIGLGKGVVFGCLIALVACHFGMRIQPNTESLGHGTTISVVSAITIVILADAVFAIVFSNVGFR